jgi:hypothetical protein
MNKLEKNIIKAKWLRTRGGRDLSDIYKDKIGEYVIMGGGKGEPMKVYLPSIEEIIETLNLKI